MSTAQVQYVEYIGIHFGISKYEIRIRGLNIGTYSWELYKKTTGADGYPTEAFICGNVSSNQKAALKAAVEFAWHNKAADRSE